MASAQEASRALKSLQSQKQDGAMKALSVEQVNKFKEAIADVNAFRAQERKEAEAEAARLAKVQVSDEDVKAFAQVALLSEEAARAAIRAANGDLSVAMQTFVTKEPYPELVRFTANIIA